MVTPPCSAWLYGARVHFLCLLAIGSGHHGLIHKDGMNPRVWAAEKVSFGPTRLYAAKVKSRNISQVLTKPNWMAGQFNRAILQEPLGALSNQLQLQFKRKLTDDQQGKRKKLAHTKTHDGCLAVPASFLLS